MDTETRIKRLLYLLLFEGANYQLCFFNYDFIWTVQVMLRANHFQCYLSLHRHFVSSLCNSKFKQASFSLLRWKVCVYIYSNLRQVSFFPLNQPGRRPGAHFGFRFLPWVGSGSASAFGCGSRSEAQAHRVRRWGRQAAGGSRRWGYREQGMKQ